APPRPRVVRARPRGDRRNRLRARTAALARGVRVRGADRRPPARPLRRGGPLRDQRLGPLPGALPDGAAAARLPRVLALAAPRAAGEARRRADRDRVDRAIGPRAAFRL